MSIKDTIFKKGLGAENLDDIVIDAAQSLASNANNGGIDEQIEFLITLCGWSEEDILNSRKG